MTNRYEIEIRSIQSSDYEKWLALWQGYQTFYKANILPEVTRTTWERMLNQNEPVYGALAIVGGEIIGMVHWIFHRSCWTTGDYCYLQDLFVASDRRKQGVGKSLIEHVYSIAEQAGCSRVYWLTHESNSEAIRLYDGVAERSGFIQYRKNFPAIKK